MSELTNDVYCDEHASLRQKQHDRYNEHLIMKLQ